MVIGVGLGVMGTRESLLPWFRRMSCVVCEILKIDFAAAARGGRRMGSTAPFEVVPASGSTSRDAVGPETAEAAVRYPRRPAARATL